MLLVLPPPLYADRAACTYPPGLPPPCLPFFLPPWQAPLLGELEGSALAVDGQGCGAALRELRTLAQRWAEDAMRRSNM